jgi:hypothetical protein
VGYVVVIVAVPNHAFVFLYGRDANKRVFGVGNEDREGGRGQQRHKQRATKWVKDDQQKTTTNHQWELCNDGR